MFGQLYENFTDAFYSSEKQALELYENFTDAFYSSEKQALELYENFTENFTDAFYSSDIELVSVMFIWFCTILCIVSACMFVYLLNNVKPSVKLSVKFNKIAENISDIDDRTNEYKDA